MIWVVAILVGYILYKSRKSKQSRQYRKDIDKYIRLSR